MLKIGDWTFDEASRRLLRNSVVRRISPKTAGVLSALLKTPGQVWSREAILEEVWPCVVVGDEVLTHAIAELRRAFGETAYSPLYIETVHKNGYRLSPDIRVEPVDAEKAPGPQKRDPALDAPTLSDYALFLDAQDQFQCGDARGAIGSINGFKNIVASYPRYAPGHAWLSASLTFYGVYYDPKGAHLTYAQECYRRALELDPYCSEGHMSASLSLSISGDPGSCDEHSRRALAYDRSSYQAHYLTGRILLSRGEHAAAATMLAQAARLRPEDYTPYYLAAKALRGLDREADALRYMQCAHRGLSSAGYSYDACRRLLCVSACCHLEFGENNAAHDLIALVDDADPVKYYISGGLTRAGEIDAALDCLENAVEAGWAHKDWLVNDPDLDALREEPRFKHIENSLPSGIG